MTLNPALRTAVTYIAFAATGFAWALPGVLLPEFIRAWHLTDFHAGTLFFSLGLSAAVGALLVRGKPTFITALGTVLAAVGGAGFARFGGPGASISSALYGLGLGMAMTAMSMLHQRMHEDRRGVELVRLNLMWSAGAAVSPLAAARALRTHHAEHLLLGQALFFLCIAFWFATAGASKITLPNASGFSIACWRRMGRIPLALVLATLAIPGIEAASGGWIATFASRSDGWPATTIAAPTCLWAGSLASRVLASLLRSDAVQQRIVSPLLLVAATAACLIVARPQGTVIVCGAFVLGFALGPLYPLFIARVMAIEEVPTIFFLAGIAAATLPWLTGAVATWTHSLRAGMIAIAATALIAFLLNWKSERTRIA